MRLEKSAKVPSQGRADTVPAKAVSSGDPGLLSQHRAALHDDVSENEEINLNFVYHWIKFSHSRQHYHLHRQKFGKNQYSWDWWETAYRRSDRGVELRVERHDEGAQFKDDRAVISKAKL